jgi:hypothetical protein
VDRRLGAVGRRRHAQDLAERPAERAEAREADVEADLRDAAVGLAQEERRALDPAALQVAVRRLAEDGAELAREMGAGDVATRASAATSNGVA